MTDTTSSYERRRCRACYQPILFSRSEYCEECLALNKRRKLFLKSITHTITHKRRHQLAVGMETTPIFYENRKLKSDCRFR